MRFSIKKSRKIIIKLILLSLIVYVIFLFMDQYIKIRNKQEEVENLNKQISIQKKNNEEILDMLEGTDSSEEGNKPKEGQESGNSSHKRVFENATE